MSYIECENCGKKVFNKNEKCPFCGRDEKVRITEIDNAENIKRPL